MSLINGGYFINDINLTGEQINNITSSDNNESSYLDVFEEEILRKLMGYNLYEAYLTDLNGTQTPSAQRFKELVDGAVFTVDSITQKWNGIRDESRRKSLVAYYAYYIFRNEEESFNSNAGQVVLSKENSQGVSVISKLVSTWNKLVDLYGEIPTEYVYDEYFIDLSCYVHFNIKASAYNFLLANKENYPEWRFEPLDKKSIFGI